MPALFVAVHDAVFVRVSARGAVRVAVSALAEIPGDVVVRLALVPRVILLPPRVLQPARVPLTHAEVEDRVRFQLPRTELFLLVAQLAQLRGVPASEPGRVVLLPLKQLRPLVVVRDSLVLRAHRFGGVHVRGGARRRRTTRPRPRRARASARSAPEPPPRTSAGARRTRPTVSARRSARTGPSRGRSSSSSAGWISDGGGSVGGCGGEGTATVSGPRRAASDWHFGTPRLGEVPTSKRARGRREDDGRARGAPRRTSAADETWTPRRPRASSAAWSIAFPGSSPDAVAATSSSRSMSSSSSSDSSSWLISSSYDLAAVVARGWVGRVHRVVRRGDGHVVARRVAHRRRDTTHRVRCAARAPATLILVRRRSRHRLQCESVVGGRGRALSPPGVV